VRAKGKVTVTIESNGESIDLSVMDNGQGMTPEVREQLFQPFATTRSNGFGLGLFSCMQIAREHGATIECNSELGQGTTMKVSFPRTT
jgi:signal transduction histidine kinase